MNSLQLLAILIIVVILCCGFYKVVTVKKLVKVREIELDIEKKKDVDLLNENQFNLDKMNPNKWNYGNKDFAPYIDGSYKQVTNNYVPGFKFNNYSINDFYDWKKPAVYDTKINAWRNQSDSNAFLVQCK